MKGIKQLYRILLIAIRTAKIQILDRAQHRRGPLGYPLNANAEPILWMTYPLVDFLSSIDFNEASVFEYGSGGSTLWWSKRVNKIKSIEYNEGWLNVISGKAPANASIMHHPINPGYAKTIHNFGEKYDVVVIDGAHRFSCSKEAPAKLKPNGIIILDNTEWHLNTARSLREQGFLQIDFAGFCPLNSFPSVSSIFFRPSPDCVLYKRNDSSIIPYGGKPHPEGVCYDDLN